MWLCPVMKIHKRQPISAVLTNPLNSWPLQKHMAQIAFMEHIYGLLFLNNPAEISCKFRRFALLKTSHKPAICVLCTQALILLDLNSINWSKGCKIEPHCTCTYLKLPVVWSYSVDHLLCYRHRSIIMNSLTEIRVLWQRSEYQPYIFHNPATISWQYFASSPLCTNVKAHSNLLSRKRKVRETNPEGKGTYW
jgi:hypothetical protein